MAMGRVLRERLRSEAARGGSWKIVRGDTVVVRAGREKGKTGVVKEVLRKEMRVVVEGLNKRRKPIKSDTPGRPRWVEIEMPIAYSNVGLADPLTKKPVRSRWVVDDSGLKTRMTVRERVIKARWGEEGEPDRKPGAADTPLTEALRPTYEG
eukprot:PRCOL_00005792-RA